MTAGTDLARSLPDVAARLVARTMRDRTGTTRNAWDVLVSAFGPVRASELVRVHGGDDVPALVRVHAEDLPGYVDAPGHADARR